MFLCVAGLWKCTHPFPPYAQQMHGHTLSGSGWVTEQLESPAPISCFAVRYTPPVTEAWMSEIRGGYFGGVWMETVGFPGVGSFLVSYITRVHCQFFQHCLLLWIIWLASYFPILEHRAQFCAIFWCGGIQRWGSASAPHWSPGPSWCKPTNGGPALPAAHTAA